MLLGAACRAGQRIAGPAVVELPTTTVVVYPGWTATVTERGDYLLEREHAAANATEGGRMSTAPQRTFDPILLAVLANRLDGIVPRDDEHAAALRRARRCINKARDFSCALVTADNELLASAEGLPVHIIGTAVPGRGDDASCTTTSPRATRSCTTTRTSATRTPADHAILVPVFVDGEHLFTAVAKAHQADCGNAPADHVHARRRATSTRRAR